MKWKLVWFGISALTLLAMLLLSNRTLRPAAVLPTLAVLPTQNAPPTANEPTPAAAVPASTLTPTVIIAPSATITETPLAARPTLTISADTPFDTRVPLEVQFDGIFSLPLEQRRVVEAVLNANRRWLPPENRFTVSAYRDVTGWAKVTLVPTRFVESSWSGVESIAPFVVQLILQLPDEADPHWNVYLVGSPEFNAVLPSIPREFVDFVSPIPALTGEYLLPWPDGQTWWATNGWHGGNAIDFQPGLSARFAVIAAQSGVLSEICSDGYQSLLQILHSDGRATYYLHVTLDLTVRRHLLDHPVTRGQYLGDIIRQTNFNTPCGYGGGRHLHFVVSDRALMIDGYPIDQIANTASCCANPPEYTSSNVRVDESAS